MSEGASLIRNLDQTAQSTALDRHLELLRQRVSKIERQHKHGKAQKESPNRLLPSWGDPVRAMPNYLAQSSLFAPIGRDVKIIHDGAELSSYGTVSLRYWGEQLSEPDSDVWMQIIHQARRIPLNQQIPFVRSHFLQAIGRHTGKNDYKWLTSSLMRLTRGTLMVKAKRYTLGCLPDHHTQEGRIDSVLHLVDGFDWLEDLETYVLRIDQRTVQLFSNDEFSLIDWPKRLQIKRQKDMAKALQRLLVTSSDTVQRYRLEWLKAKLLYTGRWRDFETAITKATKELERLEIIASPRLVIGSNGAKLVVWSRL